MAVVIIKSLKELPRNNGQESITLPVLPVKTAIIFPGEIHTIQIGRPEGLELLRTVSDKD
jgi:ATP-dependent Lon protease